MTYEYIIDSIYQTDFQKYINMYGYNIIQHKYINQDDDKMTYDVVNTIIFDKKITPTRLTSLKPMKLFSIIEKGLINDTVEDDLFRQNIGELLPIISKHN